MKGARSFAAAAVLVLTPGCSYDDGHALDRSLEPCTTAHCGTDTIDVRAKIAPSLGVVHDLEVTLCSGGCVSAALAGSVEAGSYSGAIDWLSLEVRREPSSYSFPAWSAFTAKGGWPLGKLAPGKELRVTIVDHGDGRTLVDELVSDLERSFVSPSADACNLVTPVRCDAWSGETKEVLPRACGQVDCASVPTATLVAELPKAVVLGLAPYVADPPIHPDPGPPWSPLRLTACRGAECEECGILLTGSAREFLACPSRDLAGAFSAVLWLPAGDLAGIQVTGHHDRASLVDGDVYSLSVRNADTGAVLVDHRATVTYGLAAPPESQCAAPEGPLCSSVELRWTALG